MAEMMTVVCSSFSLVFPSTREATSIPPSTTASSFSLPRGYATSEKPSKGKMTEAEKKKEEELVKSSFYHGLLPREDIKEMAAEPGDFLVRMTEPSKPGHREFVVSVCTDNKKNLKHFVISKNKEGKFKLMDKKTFDSIPELVANYQKKEIQKEPLIVLKKVIPKQRWELSHSDINLTKKLGEGAFGEVHKGKLKWTRMNGEKKIVDVAVKQAKLDAMTKEQVKEFMREARLMRKLDHPNVVRMYGVAAAEEPLMLVMELASDGALDSYLSKNELAGDKKTEMVVQAAWGIEYLHEKNLLHRDIAARNCLFGNGQLKLADFGLSRIGETYQMNPKNRVPIRWLAPETLRTAAYSRKTDVWSYGVLVWEIYNNGADPYNPMTIGEVLKFVKGGYHLDIKEKAPNKEIAEMIETTCFVVDAAKRWSMKEIVVALEKITKIENGSKAKDKSSYTPSANERSVLQKSAEATMDVPPPKEDKEMSMSVMEKSMMWPTPNTPGEIVTGSSTASVLLPVPIPTGTARKTGGSGSKKKK